MYAVYKQTRTLCVLQYINHTCNVFLEASQAGEHHERASGKYYGAKVCVLVGGGKLKTIDIAGFFPY